MPVLLHNFERKCDMTERSNLDLSVSIKEIVEPYKALAKEMELPWKYLARMALKQWIRDNKAK